MKRRLFQIVVLLLASAIANIAVAWTLSICSNVSSAAPFATTNVVLESEGGRVIARWWSIEIWQVPSCVKIVSKHVAPESLRIGINSFNGQPAPDTILPCWASMIQGPPGMDDSQIIVARGWPLVTLWCEIYQSPLVVRGGINLGGGTQSTTHDPRMLPFYPIWSNFLINTFFYAAILCVLLYAPGKVRRAMRRRRGLCPACAYPVGTSPVCTECGAKLQHAQPRRGDGV